ncbi:MAG: hypothetical protein Q7T74_01540 [Candidatus Saccharibacteria bacterium]|nr:hypothetical protein [Candidatus Saccharibacteria bacterium]
MKLPTASYPKNKLSTPKIYFIYGLAIVIIIMVVSQLMTIEKFLPIIENYQLPGGSPTAKITVFSLATSGIFSLPFLMRMSLSPLFRICSAILLNLYGVIWLMLAMWIVIANPPLIGIGIFGGLLKSIPGEVVLPFAIILLASTIFATCLLRKDLKFKL